MALDDSQISSEADVAKVYRAYVQQARKAHTAAPVSPTIDGLEDEYLRLEKRWRMVRHQYQRAFPEDEEEEPQRSHFPGLCVELKLAAEQSVRTYLLLSALDRLQETEELLEGGAYPLINATVGEAFQILGELDEAKDQRPPYCYVVTAVYGRFSRRSILAHAHCSRVFRRSGTVLEQGWRRYQIWGPSLARLASRNRPMRWLLRCLLADPIILAASNHGVWRSVCRAYLGLLTILTMVCEKLPSNRKL